MTLSWIGLSTSTSVYAISPRDLFTMLWMLSPACAMVVDQVREFLEHGVIANAVNFPSVEMARESPFRIGIANANVPNMVGQISTTMAKAGLNIHNMVNKSRGEMAYTLVDLDSAAAPEVIERIARIPGVLSIRAVPELVVEGRAAKPI